MDTNEAKKDEQVESGSLEPNRLPVLITREETKALVINAIRSALSTEHRSIGVSVNWLTRHVQELNLKAHEIEALVAVRTEHGGQLPQAVKFLYQGLTAQDVCGCYQARNVLQAMEHPASVKKIAMLIQTFPETDPDNEGLGDMIAEAHTIISERYFWVKYVDQSIFILCAIARKYGCVTVEAALSMVDSRRPKEMGIVSDDEEDEVEKHRTLFEDQRR